jgi:penicillin-binding protein 2
MLLIGIGVGVALVNPDTADSVLESAGLKDKKTPDPDTAGLVAPSPTTEAAATKTPKPTNTPRPVASTEGSSGSLQIALTQQAEQAAQPTLAPGETREPTTEPTNEPDANNPDDVAQSFAAAWSGGDYDGIFALFSTDSVDAAALEAFKDEHDGEEAGFTELSTSAKNQLAHDYIVGRYEAIAQEAGLTKVSVEVTGEPDADNKIPIHVAYTSGRVGEFEQDNAIQLKRDGNTWHIAWSPSLIFNNLNDGCVDYTRTAVKRGSILDRNGEILAADIEVSIVGIIPGQLTDEANTIKTLAKLLDMKTQDIKDKYQDAGDDWFVPIKTYPAPMNEGLLNDLSPLDGIVVQAGTARTYPLGAAAAHITGYVTRVNADDIAADETGSLTEGQWLGRAGIEAAANDLLSGTPGAVLRIVDCQTRSEQEEIVKRTPVQAKNLILTIDSAFQKEVDAAVGDVTGSSVVLDPRDGSVLALVSHPSFDPNWFIQGLTEDQVKTVFDEKKTPLLNRALQAGYPTGSIFKVITMSAAMAELGYTGQSEIDCPQEWTIPGTDSVFRDWTDEYGTGAQGLLTLHQALVNSCNTVFYELGYELDEKDNELLPNMTKAYGLGAPTGIPYLQEVAGVVPDPEWKLDNLNDYWATGDAVNLAIGQGYLQATPIQMANVYTAIANGGDLLQPFIVEFTTNANGGGKERVGRRTVLNEIPLSGDQIGEIQAALREQTSNTYGSGSSKVFGDFQWPIAGKTGTAENQANQAGKPHSWFAAFGPYGEKSTISSIAMVESSGEGVSFAAPITKLIYEAYLETDLSD